MNMPTSRHAQRGFALVIGMIMLLLITVMVTTAFTLSNTNLKAVGNMQDKDEATAAANVAVEQLLSSPFTTAPAAESINVDINNDGNNDYVVAIAPPVCIRASIDTAGFVSSVTLGAAMSAASSWNTVWDIEALVDNAKTGAKTTVNAGVRVLLTQTQKNTVCT